MRLSLFALCAASVIIACDRAPSAPSGNLATTAVPTAVAGAGDSTARPAVSASAPGRATVGVNMLDACDSASFDAAIGPGTCVRSGGMNFSQFTTLLQKLGMVGPWHFSPDNSHVSVGQTFVATNIGGEVHTFTEVAAFGGGIVPILNQLGGFGAPAPECAALEPDDFVAPGATYTEKVDHSGALKFQCCIHPWMRLEATSR